MKKKMIVKAINITDDLIKIGMFIKQASFTKL